MNLPANTTATAWLLLACAAAACRHCAASSDLDVQSLGNSRVAARKSARFHGLDPCSLESLEAAAQLEADRLLAATNYTSYDTTGASNAAIKHHYHHLVTCSSQATIHERAELLQEILRVAVNRKCVDESKLYAGPAFHHRGLARIQCPPLPPLRCDPHYRYRSLDGTCNNLQHPRWGSAGRAFRRLMPAIYDDGLGSPRKLSVTGRRLPSPRHVSLVVHERESRIDVEHTHMVMQFGQFIDHDMTLTPMILGSKNQLRVICCAEDAVSGGASVEELARVQAQLDERPQCFKIPVAPGDPVFSNRRCMPFVRSQLALHDDCSVGPREQRNDRTSFVDASHVYGSEPRRASDGRAFVGGRMRVQYRRGQEPLLPLATAGSFEMNNCVNSTLKPWESCFHSGDERVNEESTLTSIHTLFVLEHNRIADELSFYNPHWVDERLFQEARRIVGAALQHVTYGVYLPLVVGDRLSTEYDLYPLESGYHGDYSEDVDPSLWTEFSTGAFRYGHTLINGVHTRVAASGLVLDALTTREHFFRPERMYDDSMGGAGAFLRGLVRDPGDAFDRRFTTEVADHCYSSPNNPGVDLIALNTQRGRDHALQTYVTYRKFLGMSVPSTFDDLADTHLPETIRRFKEAYDDVRDIDVYNGGITELPMPGALVGPFFGKLIAMQMRDLKRGDRFYYQNYNPVTGFSLAQLAEIQKITLARILCDNYRFDNGIQPDVFRRPSLTNPLVPCRSLPSMDLAAWKDTFIH